MDSVELVCRVLREQFNNNQSKMAAAIGIGQPVISRVVAGKAMPGVKLLTVLAQHQGVSPESYLVALEVQSRKVTVRSSDTDLLVASIAELNSSVIQMTKAIEALTVAIQPKTMP